MAKIAFYATAALVAVVALMTSGVQAATSSTLDAQVASLIGDHGHVDPMRCGSNVCFRCGQIGGDCPCCYSD
ncbi:hypothetical protein BC828DRAFT_405797 [Blastocladiella britannica]|nr:hypothetical protein BC828DRAFT_405797 [Blastocladiella britannica]